MLDKNEKIYFYSHEQVEEDVECAIAVTDDLFLLEGVDIDTSNGQLRSPQSVFSDEERDDSELDEGIHIPSKFSNKKPEEVGDENLK